MTRDMGSLRARVVLIHHGDEQRLSAVEPTVGEVVAALDGLKSVDVQRIGYQPSPQPLLTRLVVARLLRQWLLERRWASHLGVPHRWVLSTGLLGVRLLQLASPARRARMRRQAFIELALSAKHQHAWRSAVEDGIDLLIVLEDDARAREDSRLRVADLVRLLVARADPARTYADLAGGLSIKALRLEAVTSPFHDGVDALSKAATNTTCAYLLGSEVIRLLVDAVITNPGAAKLPADWLMNRAFMRSADRRVFCFHTRPTALEHGSFTGSVASSIR